MHLAAGIFLPRMMNEVVYVSLQRPIATRGVRIEPTPHVDCEVSSFLHRGDGKIPHGLYHDGTLAARPGNDGWPVFVVMPPTGLALLPTTTRAATQRLFPTLFGLPLTTSGVIELIRLNGAFQLALHLIGQRGIAQPPAPTIAG